MASETLTGATQLKIGDVCLFVYMFGRTYVILYFDPRVFVLVLWSKCLSSCASLPLLSKFIQVILLV